MGAQFAEIPIFMWISCLCESTLEIAVLPAWELNSDEINSNVYDFLMFLWFPEKVSFCVSPFFKFYHILGSFWEASDVLLVTFGILRGVLGLVWAVFGCLSESFVRLLGPTLENFQSEKRASRSIAKTGFVSTIFSVPRIPRSHLSFQVFPSMFIFADGFRIFCLVLSCCSFVFNVVVNLF